MDAKTNTQEPVVAAVRNELTVPHSTIRFTAACFAGPGTELSLGPLRVPADVEKNPALVQKIRGAMKLLGADRIFAPTPTKFNGVIVEPTALNRVFKLGNGMVLFRNEEALADGTFLRQPGDAGIFSASGCGVTVAVLGEHMIFAHTGRDCLIDRARIEENRCSRINESVVDSIIEAFLDIDPDADLSSLHAWVLYSIEPEDFLHRFDNKDHAVYNRKVGPDVLHRLKVGARMTSEGAELDLPAIAKAQFMQYDVPGDNIHLEHGYLHKELPHTRNGGGRYLVAIVRR